jgi:glycogen debranching enzyme
MYESFAPASILIAKEGELYVAQGADDAALARLRGVLARDTVCLSPYAWRIDGARRLAARSYGNNLQEYWSFLGADRAQTVALERRLAVEEASFEDHWSVRNLSGQSQVVTLRLDAEARFIDLFALVLEEEDQRSVTITASDTAIRFVHTATDGQVIEAELTSDDALPRDLRWDWTLQPGEQRTLGLRFSLTPAQADMARPPLPSRSEWRASFADLARSAPGPAVRQAIEDVRTLLLPTPHGPYPAAGAPTFVNFFGRDGLITGMLLLPWRQDVLRAVLLFLAAAQGRRVDAFREEEPGKILHEIRRGEWSRTDRVPFGRYFGSVDSTPLFVIAARRYLAAAPDDDKARAVLTPAIDAALGWIEACLGGGHGLATFKASGSGLTVQSWKDSPNSMVGADGAPARQPLAVAEVQGYCYAALLAGADLLDQTAPARAACLRERAQQLQATFHALFWLDDLQTYAMALDADQAPLKVLSSDPGHLLWTGIAPQAFASLLAATLMGPELWSGWGVRTLGANERAYNPVSYHNGSVWPHDTALFALGLHRYGFLDQARLVAQALIDLAEHSPGRHAPELISGYGRHEFPAPVPYPHANAPQAWAAAAVIAMAGMLAGRS